MSKGSRKVEVIDGLRDYPKAFSANVDPHPTSSSIALVVMAARYTSRALLLTLLFCFLFTVAVALENGHDTLVVQVSNGHLTCNLHNRTNVLSFQESEIHECASIEKLSALKIAVEEKESPIMRQVFAWLFPFGPGWNAGKWSPVQWSVSLMQPLSDQYWGLFTSARACVHSSNCRQLQA